MKSLGQQFREKMLSRKAKDQRWSKIAQGVTQQLLEGAQNRSRRGETVRGGNYDRRYAESTKRAKGKRDPVTLRDKDYTIKRMRSEGSGKGRANIRGADRLKKHDTGTAKGGKQRQLFPKTPKQVPRGIIKYLRTHIQRLLLGG